MSSGCLIICYALYKGYKIKDHYIYKLGWLSLINGFGIYRSTKVL